MAFIFYIEHNKNNIIISIYPHVVTYNIAGIKNENHCQQKYPSIGFLTKTPAEIIFLLFWEN